ncbi:hypothetical protein L6452_21435 [Arctium lappa]|uniref:Uncharacterized protein n=1 Tax=Arctium lappa TaxID=4217 RepID=A0ACB9AXP1_ARCLA|nr:hypothetical protein L6452_21435 [Arctium lappa]
MTSNKRRPVIGNLLTSGHRCPTSPLELKILSPTGIVNCHLAGVGLAIVAALHNTTTTTTTSPLNQPPKHHHQTSKQEEEYTIVTRHNKPNNSYTNCFFYDDAGFTNNTASETCLFDISPATPDDHIKCYPPPDFLTCCHLCNKKLHGKDIYMYRGEKAFCSIECRSRKIGMDERREQICSTEAISSASHAHMPSTGIFAL